MLGGSLQGGHQPTSGLAHLGPLSTVHEPAYVVWVMHGDLGESGALVRSVMAQVLICGALSGESHAVPPDETSRIKSGVS